MSFKKKNILVMMAAIPPTYGHLNLISFAANIIDSNVFVMINSRSFEPISGAEKLNALNEELNGFNNVVIKNVDDDNAPQEPDDHPDFWNFWKNKVNETFPEAKSSWGYVVSSENYGVDMAEILDCQFLPYDINRKLVSIKATYSRQNLLRSWKTILPAARQKMMLKAAIFGQESVGKTTLCNFLGYSSDIQTIFEYARPYLETMDDNISLNEDVLENIFIGQHALQAQYSKSSVSPILLSDTDLYSTIGYCILKGIDYNQEKWHKLADANKADIYYLLNDNIPFTPDKLRYGLNKRESSLDFWIDILEQFNLNWVLVESTDFPDRMRFVKDDLYKRFAVKNKSLVNFTR